MPMIVFVIVVMLSMLFVSNQDNEDAIVDAVVYCENVKANLWPDYNDSYDVLCTDENMKEFRKSLNK